jgi:hypothetical protein
MPSLARGQENTQAILNWFITVNGVLTDAFDVGFRIFDITGGLPGVQVFPSGGGYESVGSGVGHFGVGSYFAYDNGNTEGWTPPLTEPIGTHRIEWRWKISAGAPYQSGQEDFEVLVQSAGSTVDTYINVQDVRDAGLTDTTKFPDDKVLAYIETWQAFLERSCRQWFIPKSMVLSIDGTDSDALHFGVPIISIDYLKLNRDEVALDAELYKVYKGIRYPDDRHNPRIKLVGPQEYRDIYSAPIRHGRLWFDKGRQNQEVKGTFGFVEEDMGVPKLIQRALLKLVIEKLTKTPIYVTDPADPPTPPPPVIGSVLEEWTDGHKLKYGTSGAKVAARSPFMTGITDDQEIIEIIKMYKAPIGCATPAHPSFK